MKKTSILALAIVLALIPALAAKTFTSEEYGFSFDYPEGWESPLQTDALMTLTNLSEEMPVVLTVMTEAIPEADRSKPLDDQLTAAVAEIQSTLQESGMGDIEVLTGEQSTLKGLPSYQLELKISLMDVIYMRMDNLIVKHQDAFVFFSLTAEDSVFETYAETFTALLESFRLSEEPEE